MTRAHVRICVGTRHVVSESDGRDCQLANVSRQRNDQPFSDRCSHASVSSCVRPSTCLVSRRCFAPTQHVHHTLYKHRHAHHTSKTRARAQAHALKPVHARSFLLDPCNRQQESTQGTASTDRDFRPTCTAGTHKIVTNARVRASDTSCPCRLPSRASTHHMSPPVQASAGRQPQCKPRLRVSRCVHTKGIACADTCCMHAVVPAACMHELVPACPSPYKRAYVH